MPKEIIKKSNTRFITTICASLGFVLILSIVYLLIHFNVFTKSNKTIAENVDPDRMILL